MQIDFAGKSPGALMLRIGINWIQSGLEICRGLAQLQKVSKFLMMNPLLSISNPKSKSSKFSDVRE